MLKVPIPDIGEAGVAVMGDLGILRLTVLVFEAVSETLILFLDFLYKNFII